MHVTLDAGRAAGRYFEMDLLTARANDPRERLRDLAYFSEDAVRAFHESKLEPLVDKALSLEQIERRIAVVRAEIAEVWNSALPDKEKNRLISSKELEISLLQAGQFTFARAGFYRAA
jgi:uncharacterized small protein (DUF1192 family)